MPTRTFFTSDTHFLHKKICEYSNRPFASLEEMEVELIANWNSVVGPKDRVFHLGDFALTAGRGKNSPKAQAERNRVDTLLSRLNGQKALIKGNHDRSEVTESSRWNFVKDYHEIKVDLGGVHRQRIVMSHYAHRVWNQMHRGSWMLFGHSHGNLFEMGGLTMDVGVDPNNYTPVSLEEVKSFMSGREIITFDHHTIDSDIPHV